MKEFDNDLVNKKSEEELKKIIVEFENIIKNQNELILKIKNQFIILENNFNYLKNRTDKYEIYKKFCEIILNKINHNPITSLWFVYSIKKKITQYNKNFN